MDGHLKVAIYLKRVELVYHVDIIKHFTMESQFLMEHFFISGNPVLVQVSVSLRNILEIDEHKQVNYVIHFADDYQAILQLKWIKCIDVGKPSLIIITLTAPHTWVRLFAYSLCVCVKRTYIGLSLGSK